LKTKVILTGATGMVGEGVLLECLAHSNVEKVLVIGRRSCSITHIKLEEVLHNDFKDLSPITEKFKGYDACFFCAGVTSVGKNEDEYSHLTYDMTTSFAKTFIEQNPNSKLTFCYVSGYGTSSTEQGK
jgi:nucleoside-diphosphate-sugar epimerase